MGRDNCTGRFLDSTGGYGDVAWARVVLLGMPVLNLIVGGRLTA